MPVSTLECSGDFKGSPNPVLAILQEFLTPDEMRLFFERVERGEDVTGMISQYELPITVDSANLDQTDAGA